MTEFLAQHFMWIEVVGLTLIVLLPLTVVFGTGILLKGVFTATSWRERDVVIWQLVYFLSSLIGLVTIFWLLPFKQSLLCMVPFSLLIVGIGLVLERRRKSAAQTTSRDGVSAAHDP